MERIRQYKSSILVHTVLIFVVAIMLSNLLTFSISAGLVGLSFQHEKREVFSGVSTAIQAAIEEYDSYEWIFSYLIRNLDSGLELYYEENEEIRNKENDFFRRHNNQRLTEIKEEQLESFSGEDQKLFVQMVYYRWIELLNGLMGKFHFSYLSVIAVDENTENKIFLLSGSTPVHKRGTGETGAYVFGIITPNTEKEKVPLKELADNEITSLNNSEFVSAYNKYFEIEGMDIVAIGTFTYSDSIKSIKHDTRKMLSVYTYVQLFVFTFCLVLLCLLIIKPIWKLRKDIREFSKTKDSEKIKKQLGDVKPGNEIGALASDFSSMIDEIDSYIDEIRHIAEEKERINTELNVATQVQAGILPSVFPPFPEKKEFDIYASMDPAKEVGGDFYDFFMVDERHIALVIADVSGKGMPAALFMVVSKTMIKDRALMGGGPEEILYDVNNQLCEGNKGQMFVTVWLAIIDIETGRGLAANAGHEHPALRRAGESFELIKYSHSPMMAVISGIQFKEHEFVLHPGDRLFVYTDGVPEATNQEEKLYGLERMVESLNRHRDASIKELLENVKKDIDTFVDGAEQFDDITMLVFEYNGKV